MWDELESLNGVFHGLYRWNEGTRMGMENAIVKTGGSTYAKNVLLYRDGRFTPEVAFHGSVKDFVRQFIDAGHFDAAISQYEGKYVWGDPGWETYKKPQGKATDPGNPVSGKTFVIKALDKLVSMLLYPRTPEDKREVSAFHIDSDKEGNVELADTSIADAIELLTKNGYTVSKA
jgi:hypothetical protein